ncbi:MAG: FtsW/RodA/SpoVE family cell cycle protein [Bacilli bacterium]|nr:FtsW/RodA/SpoVE family cell cycle protein [Bacilli bacterium]
MKRIFSKMDKPLLFVTIVFFLFGLLMILSASSMESYIRYENSPYNYFYRQGAFLILGLIASILIIRIPTKVYKGFSYLLLIGIITCLGCLTAYGYAANNAVSWFKIGQLNIQPSEFAKIIVIIYLACYYDRKRDELNDTWQLIKPIIPVLIIFGLVFIQPDFGTAIVIALISFFMFFALPMSKLCRFKFTSLVLLFAVAVAGLFIITKGSFLKGYQLERFNFKDPCLRYKQDSGYQLCNSFIAFKNGNLTGQGIGKSTQKFLYLPESYTDFIFPIIVEEWGLIVGIIIILIYLFVIYRVYVIAKKATNLQTSLLAYGVCIYIFLHVSINLIGVMGIGPLTGVPLPFLSYGGSYTISLLIALAIAQRVAIESNRQKKKKK